MRRKTDDFLILAAICLFIAAILGLAFTDSGPAPARSPMSAEHGR